jgi:hypothetical protein
MRLLAQYAYADAAAMMRCVSPRPLPRSLDRSGRGGGDGACAASSLRTRARGLVRSHTLCCSTQPHHARCSCASHSGTGITRSSELQGGVRNMAFPARDVHDWFDEDGEEDELPPPNQLALVPPGADAEEEAPLLPPSALNVSGHIPKGSTRKVSCGLCRNCLFSPAQARAAARCTADASLLTAPRRPASPPRLGRSSPHVPRRSSRRQSVLCERGRWRDD